MALKLLLARTCSLALYGQYCTHARTFSVVRNLRLVNPHRCTRLTLSLSPSLFIALSLSLSLFISLFISLPLYLSPSLSLPLYISLCPYQSARIRNFIDERSRKTFLTCLYIYHSKLEYEILLIWGCCCPSVRTPTNLTGGAAKLVLKISSTNVFKAACVLPLQSLTNF